MRFKEAFKTVALGTAIAVGIGGVAYGVHQLNEAAHPVEKGERYLADKGYSNISGGGTSVFNACGKNVYAREYNVTNPESGQRETRTVCFSPLFGPHAPLFGK